MITMNPYLSALDNPMKLDQNEHQSECAAGMAIPYKSIPPYIDTPTEAQMRREDMYWQIRVDRERRRERGNPFA
jgi:hypothetical protein